MSLSLYIYIFSWPFAAHNNISCSHKFGCLMSISTKILYQECDSLLHFVVTVGISLKSSLPSFTFSFNKEKYVLSIIKMMTFLYHRSSSHMVAHAVRLKLIISFTRINIKTSFVIFFYYLISFNLMIIVGVIWQQCFPYMLLYYVILMLDL